MPPSNRRSRSSLLLPVALTATAAVASLALYYWLGDDSQQPAHDHRHDGRRSRSRDEPRRARPRRRAFSHDRITEMSEPESEVPARRQLFAQQQLQHQAASQLKPSIAIVVTDGPEERTSALLNHLPTPLNTSAANIFVLVHSPRMKMHPLAEEGAREGRVVMQARQLFPLEYPAEFIMPFTEKESVVPILRQLAPQSVYIEGSLVGQDGEVVDALLKGGWVGGVIVARSDGEVRDEKDIKGNWGKKLRVVEVGDVGDDWMAYVTE